MPLSYKQVTGQTDGRIAEMQLRNMRAYFPLSTLSSTHWYKTLWISDFGLFVAVAGSTAIGVYVMTSPDGMFWTIRAVSTQRNWYDLAYSSSLKKAIAVTPDGTADKSNMMISSDGINWSYSYPNLSNGYFRVCWANELGIFIAVNAGLIAQPIETSIDGVNWISRTVTTINQWSAVCWSSELRLAVAVSYTGIGNRVMTSPDGITWTTRSSAADNEWYSVAWSPKLGLFAAVSRTGSGDRVMTSPDGINWTTRSSSDNDWFRVEWIDGFDVFIASALTGSVGYMMISYDGITWTDIVNQSMLDKVRPHSFAYDDSRNIFVAVGSQISSSTFSTLAAL